MVSEGELFVVVEDEPLGVLEEVRAMVLGETTISFCFSCLDEDDVVDDDNDGGGGCGVAGVGDGATAGGLDC